MCILEHMHPMPKHEERYYVYVRKSQVTLGDANVHVGVVVL